MSHSTLPFRNGKRAQAALAARRVAPLLMAAAALCVSLPAAAGLFDDDVARQQVAQQAKRVEELRAQNEAMARQIDTLSGRLAKLEDAMKNQPVLDLANQMEALREELKGLRGQIEVLGNNIEGSAKRQRDMYVDLDTRMRRFEQAATPVPPAPVSSPGAANPPGGAPEGAAAAASADETRAYEAAQNQRRIGNYQAAIVGFQGFIAKYPKSSLAPRAQYWIGDSYFNLRDYKNAIASQQKLISAYGESTSVPDAMLNIASSQVELGETAAARKTMDGLVSRYPSSEAAEKAKRRLATLR